ncbi:MAG: aminoglycoside phosphotransferase family protein [Dehalococcoidia bacterium]
MSAVTRLGSGYAAEAYLLRAPRGIPAPPSGRSRGGSAPDLVLRLPKPPLAHSVPLLRREARLLRALERFDLGVAFPSDMREVRDGRAFLGTLHEYVPGTPYPRGLRGAARARLCDGIGRFLAALHGVPREVAARAGVPERDLWPDVYRPLIAEALPHLGPGARAWLAATGEAFARGGGTRRAPRTLVHGDVQRAHLLARADGTLVGAIDFGEAIVADPALDFAGVLNDLGWRDLEHVWAAYRVAGGVADADAPRRTRFYIAVVPIYRVLYGEAAEGPAERLAGIRQFAARAAASRRRGTSAGG